MSNSIQVQMDALLTACREVEGRSAAPAGRPYINASGANLLAAQRFADENGIKIPRLVAETNFRDRKNAKRKNLRSARLRGRKVLATPKAA